MNQTVKTPSAFFWFPSVLGLVLLAQPLPAQGPLAPPGAPAPMMKTLQQMEPRTHIENAGYVITVPGSYYLTANLNGPTAIGIKVQASGVTIDLRGFAITNCQVGIAAVAGVRTVAVANGSVSTCSGAGVDLSQAEHCRLEGVISSNNTGDGVSVGSGSIVTLCTAANNGGRGLVLGDGGTVFRCVAQTNGNSGIVIASNCQATENTCTSNGAGAGQAGLLTMGAGNRVEGNSANQNNGQGYQINGSGNLVIRNNACSNTVADYSMAAGNSYGQIVLSPGAGFINSNAWANFGCGAQSGTCQIDGDCNDNNTCTTDTCVAGTCVFTPIAGCSNTGCASAADCNDNNACTTDTCVANACVHTAVPGCGNTNCTGAADCNDGNACTTDTCVAGSCVHTAVPGCGGTGCVANSDCNDGNTCTTDACQNGSCVHTAIPGCGGTGCVADSDCNDGNACTNDHCDVTTHACIFSAAANGTACDDGNVCTVNDVCQGGACIGTLNPNCGGACSNGSTQACYTGPAGTSGIGACHAGIQTCSAGAWGACTGEVTPSAEVCDSIDNNCNGMVDDGIICNQIPLTVSKSGSGTGTVYSVPAGISCGATCAANFSSGTMVTLTATAGLNSSFVGWSGACSGTGTCTVTMNSATSVMATFTYQCTPSTEVCDNVDNNCNGMIDEGDPGGGVPCSTGQPGVCASGVTHCQNGAIVCVQNVYPSAETCDGLDNNCNGTVDEGDPGGGGACNTGMSGACAAGTVHCQNGTLVCVQNVAASAEVCGDGIDNNCNGVVDEGCGATGSACVMASNCASGVCTGGTCHAPTCSDMVKNGNETGVDCGGGTCTTCGVGQTCYVGADCTSGVCSGGHCQ